ncbi:hypothetical protein V8C40DRAFT_271730 [Trichoderma camerunense]
MPSSSTKVVDTGSYDDAKLHVSSDNSSHTYAIDRFLADQQHHNPAFWQGAIFS